MGSAFAPCYTLFVRAGAFQFGWIAVVGISCSQRMNEPHVCTLVCLRFIFSNECSHRSYSVYYCHCCWLFPSSISVNGHHLNTNILSATRVEFEEQELCWVTGENLREKILAIVFVPMHVFVSVCACISVWQIRLVECDAMDEMLKSERAGCDLRQHPWTCVCLISENGRDFCSSRIIINNTSQPASQLEQAAAGVVVIIVVFSLCLPFSQRGKRVCCCTIQVCIVCTYVWFVLFFTSCQGQSHVGNTNTTRPAQYTTPQILAQSFALPHSYTSLQYVCWISTRKIFCIRLCWDLFSLAFPVLFENSFRFNVRPLLEFELCEKLWILINIIVVIWCAPDPTSEIFVCLEI